MANRPRLDNPHRSIRVEDDLWGAAEDAAKAEDTTRAEVMRQALRNLVERNKETRRLDRGMSEKMVNAPEACICDQIAGRLSICPTHPD